jgi:hypothetical protein
VVEGFFGMVVDAVAVEADVGAFMVGTVLGDDASGVDFMKLFRPEF